MYCTVVAGGARCTDLRFIHLPDSTSLRQPRFDRISHRRLLARNLRACSCKLPLLSSESATAFVHQMWRLGIDSSHCVYHSVFLKSADQCLRYILTGTGVGSDLVVTVVSGNRTLTTSGQTRVAAFNGSAVFTGLTVRAPTEVCLASFCGYPWLSGVWQCCLYASHGSTCSAPSPS
jgi:hypothetical protein